MYDTLRFWTMSAADFLDEYFESDIVKAHFAGSSIIGTALGPRSPGHRLRAAASLHGRHRRHRRRLGLRARRHGGDQQRARQVLRGERRHDPQRRPGGADPGEGRARVGRGARERRGDSCAAGDLQSRRQAHLPEDRWMPKDLPADFLQRVKNFKIRGSSGKLNIALDGLPRFPAIPAGLAVHARRHARHRHARNDGARLRRLEGGPLVARALHRHADSLADRSDHGARRQALHVGVRAVLPLRARRGRVERRQAPGFRRHGDRYHRAAQPELQGSDSARGNPHAVGYRERSRA